jgi:hypothetical protein
LQESLREAAVLAPFRRINLDLGHASRISALILYEY